MIKDMSMIRAAVIGFGSIGQRHAHILKGLGCDVSILSRRALGEVKSYQSLHELMTIESPNYIIVANETAAHHKILSDLATMEYKGKILVEKPLYSEVIPQSPKMLDLHKIGVGYNLRFHPLIKRLFEFLSDKKIYTAQLHVGQWLPDWRPNQDYRQGYSASKGAGGGVLRDLSHELDLIHWLFGKSKQVCALSGQVSDLEISAEDAVSLLIVSEKAAQISLTLNYLDKPACRQYRVTGDFGTVEVDLIKNIFILNSEVEKHNPIERDETYQKMHIDFIKGEGKATCSYDDGLFVNRLIEIIEQSQQNQTWIKL